MVITVRFLKVILVLNFVTFMYILLILYPLANKNHLFGLKTKTADQFANDLNSAEQFIQKLHSVDQLVKKLGILNNRLEGRNLYIGNDKFLPIRTNVNTNSNSKTTQSIIINSKELTIFSKFKSAAINSMTSNIYIGNTGLQRGSTQKPYNMTLLENYQLHTKLYHNKGLCAGLFKNNSKLLLKSADLNTTIAEDQTTLENFIAMTQECSLYKSVRRFRNKPLSTEEENFPIALSILIHSNLEQFERLLKSLYHPQNAYCVHVDEKASPLFKEATKSIVNCFDNVFLVSQPIAVVYASFSRLQADWNCLSDLRKHSVKWRYHINLAGSEFPLVSNPELVKILKLMNGSNDIRERYSQRIPSRFSHKYFVVNGTIHKSKEKLSPPPYNLTITKGLAYNTISREFVEYIFSNRAVQEFLNWNKETYSPDEHFWSTLNDLYHNSNLKSPGGYKGHPDDNKYFSRYINWNVSSDRCHGTYIRNVCVFTYGDLWYLQLKHHLIANKFDIRKDSLAFACMEELIQNRTEHPRKINPNFYRTA